MTKQVDIAEKRTHAPRKTNKRKKVDGIERKRMEILFEIKSTIKTFSRIFLMNVNNLLCIYSTGSFCIMCNNPRPNTVKCMKINLKRLSVLSRNAAIGINLSLNGNILDLNRLDGS